MNRWVRLTVAGFGLVLVVSGYRLYALCIKLLLLAGYDGLVLLGSALGVWLIMVPMGVYLFYIVDLDFPVSGYNGNDTTESGDINGE